MSTAWSEPEIERRAQGLAAALRGVAATARNEEELRIGAVRVLEQFAEDAGIELEARHEYALGRGRRADSLYGRVLIEFERPGSLAAGNDAPPNQRAVGQAEDYVQRLARQDRVELHRILGAVTDGCRIVFVRHLRGKWEVSPPRDVDQSSVAHLLFCLRSLQTKPLLPQNLVEDFSADPKKAAGACVRALYRAHDRSKSPRVDALFRQWQMLFSEVCGYELDSPKLDVQALARSYGVTAKRPDPARLFFCVHSYYATLIKLLAAEMVTFYSADFLPSYLGGLEALPSDRLRQELTALEEGGIFAQLGVRNFLEGDFFAWYLEEWDGELDSALKGIVRALRAYDPATFRVDPEQTRDLLKKLYQYLLPKKLRHDLGEYYTPDWLAELVLEEIGYDGDLGKRILDPACGSGTFLVLEIKRAKEWGQERFVGEAETLRRILGGIVGFDLNPLAVITARTNYLIALGDLLRHRTGDVEIPVYLCDSVLAPSEYGRPTATKTGNLFMAAHRVETSVDGFDIPLCVATRERISSLAAVLERAVQGSYEPQDFLALARSEIGLEPGEFAESERLLVALYARMRELAKQKRNGIWARIVKNFFAPIFAGRFDYVAGNPPWINWENLPDKYRRSTQHLWEHYGMAARAGKSQFELGKVKRDLSALFLCVAADKYLSERGRLGFLVTESLFTSGAAEGFRRFQMPPEPGEWPERLRVLRVHDLVDVKPFEGSANRTALIALEKTPPQPREATRYPVQYIVWRKLSGERADERTGLAQMRRATTRHKHAAFPVSAKPTAPWITGAPRALRAVQKAMGPSDYKARAGACTWLNGVYWVRILQDLPGGRVLVENLHDVGKLAVRRTQCRIEADLLYPLLHGQEVKPWRAESAFCIIVPHTPESGWEALSESDMRRRYPLTYAYLHAFKQQLLHRSGYRQLRKGHPFYIMGNVGRQSFAKYKVVWRRMIPVPRPAVVACAKGAQKAPVPTEILTFVPLGQLREAHYVCALIGSAVCGLISSSYSTGKSFGAPHILDHVAIPRFDAKNALHKRLAKLSEQAHRAAARGDTYRLAQIEAQVDEAAARLWGITEEELKVIQRALAPRDRSVSKATGVADSPDEDAADEADDSADG